MQCDLRFQLCAAMLKLTKNCWYWAIFAKKLCWWSF